MGILIDASVLIAVERDAIDLESLLAEHGEDDVALAAVTASELLHGVHRAPRGKKRLARERFVERLLSSLPIVPFDLVVARTHARLWADLASKGRGVGERDLMIAATAVARDLAVATRDRRSFPKIVGVDVLYW